MVSMTNFLSFQIHGSGMSGGVAANVASLLEFLESLSGKTPPEMFSAVFPGISAIENIHPVLVHFPIAFFTAFFIVDSIGVLAKKSQWRYVSAWLLYLGTLSAIFTVIAGLFAANSVEHGDDVHDIMDRHQHIGIAVLSLSLFLSAWRLKQWGIRSTGVNTVFLSLSGFLCFLLFLGADLGGLMVYQYGVAVNSQAINTSGQGGDLLKGLPSITEGAHNHASHSHEHDGHSHGGHQHSHGGHQHTH